MRNERVQQLLSDKADRRGLMAALDASQALIWFSPEGRVLDSNANTQTLLDYTPDMLAGLTYYDLIHAPFPPDRNTQIHWERIASGAIPNEERSYYTRSGSEVWSSASYAAIRSESGKTRRVFAIIIDLSPWSWKPKDASVITGRG